jgi:hypothetical protein
MISLACGLNGNELTPHPRVKQNCPRCDGIKGVVSAHPHIFSGIKFGSPLTDKDISRLNELAPKFFDT